MSSRHASERGRKPINMLAAAEWLRSQPDLLAIASADIQYRNAPPGAPVNRNWKRLADAFKLAGFYSSATGALDVPVRRICEAALAHAPNA